MALNDLEEAIGKGLKITFKEYGEMADYWLWHAPEYFITVGVGRAIHKETGAGIYMDASLKRIYKQRKDQGEPLILGKPPSYLSNRPDISVWFKSSEKIRAAIEIKRASNISPVKKDVARLRRIVGKAHGPKVGYAICYSEARPKESTNASLEKRFSQWEKETGTNRIITEFRGPDDNGWWCGWCVLRVDETP